MTVSERAPRVLVVEKTTTYQLYAREKKNRRFQQLLDVDDPTVKNVLSAHEDHTQAVARTHEVLKQLGAEVTFCRRREMPELIAFDLVVTLGGDGTLLWASHRVGATTPMLAINTSPGNSVGYFCAGTKDTVETVLTEALAGTLRATELTRMAVTVDERRITSRVLNDVLLCHECPAATSRYLLSHGGVDEDQRSSGIWIGPAAGSTAAQRSAGGKTLPIRSQRLQFVVREPYTPPGEGYQLVQGLIEPGESLVVRSKMADGRVFVDGPYQMFELPMGAHVVLTRSEEPLTLLGERR